MRRKLTPKRLVLLAVFLVLAVAGGLCGVAAGRIVGLSEPPGGRLVARHGAYRVYVVKGTDSETLRKLKDWARRWGNRTSNTYSGYGGPLSFVTVESQGAMVIDGVRYAIPKGHYQVCVRDEKLTPMVAWERLKQVLTGKL